jgi:hypothetical protein
MTQVNTQTTLTPDQMLAMIAKLEAENEALKSAPQKRLTCKVSEKGALSVYGLGRFPVTLYAGQWERLFAAKDEIAQFAKANAHLLAAKPTA